MTYTALTTRVINKAALTNKEIAISFEKK